MAETDGITGTCFSATHQVHRNQCIEGGGDVTGRADTEQIHFLLRRVTVDGAFTRPPVQLSDRFSLMETENRSAG